MAFNDLDFHPGNIRVEPHAKQMDSVSCGVYCLKVHKYAYFLL